MPCKECGDCAHTNGSHGSVVGLSHDEYGIARYTCLKCTIELLKAESE